MSSADSDNLPALRYSVSDVAEMAKNVSKSGLFGMNEAQCMTLMLIAQSKGLHPIQAVERFHVIQGRPAMKSEAMLAEFQARGGQVEWHQHDHAKCEATFEAPGVKTPTTVSWSQEDAKKAGLLSNPMWGKYTRQMLRARVISEGIRMTMPGILSGIYTPEEISDMEPIRRDARIVEPAPATLPARHHPNNGTDYGRGQYASPEQVQEYSVAVEQFVARVNAEWLDEWTGEGGEVAEGITDLLRTPQLTGHLLKWGLATGKLAPVDMTWDHETGKPTEKVSVGKAKKYVAIMFDRDHEELTAEAERYADEEADKARAAWHEKHGEPEPVAAESAGGREPGDEDIPY